MTGVILFTHLLQAFASNDIPRFVTWPVSESYALNGQPQKRMGKKSQKRCIRRLHFMCQKWLNNVLREQVTKQNKTSHTPPPSDTYTPVSTGLDIDLKSTLPYRPDSGLRKVSSYI